MMSAPSVMSQDPVFPFLQLVEGSGTTNSPGCSQLAAGPAHPDNNIELDDEELDTSGDLCYLIDNNFDVNAESEEILNVSMFIWDKMMKI